MNDSQTDIAGQPEGFGKRALTLDTKSLLGWLGWLCLLAGFAFVCFMVAGLLLDNLPTDSAVWWIATVCTGGAFAIGFVYRRRRWIAAPMAVGVALLLVILWAALVAGTRSFGLGGLRTLPVRDAAIIVTILTLLATQAAAAGVNRGNRAGVPGMPGIPRAPESLAVPGRVAPLPGAAGLTPEALTLAESDLQYAPDSRDYIEVLLSTPIPDDLSSQPAARPPSPTER